MMHHTMMMSFKYSNW